MVRFQLLTCCLLAVSASNVKNKSQSISKKFPSDFAFGTSTAAYQIEGAWDVDGKGMSIWDYLVRTDPDHIADRSNGDIATNSYYNYKRDIEMLKELGVTHYRFSISWPRILPFGRDSYVNQRGIDHYNNFIDELIGNGIVPFVTIYHWDLPQNLQERGGWLNEEIVDLFGDYARILYQNFGDRVKLWLTINEPFVHCNFGYGYGRHAPRMRSPGSGFYECGRQILLANARAYRIYDDEFRDSQGGKVGIGLNSEYAYPASDSEEDVEATKDYLEFHEYGPGLHDLLVYIKDTYNNPLVFITENGVSTKTGLNDNIRVSYYRSYLSALLDAISKGCNVQGYFAWSLMDNFEWSLGYTQRFGLYEVDFEDLAHTRTPRKSALVYQEIIRSREIDYDYNPDPYDTGSARAGSASLLAVAIAVFNVLV